MRIFDKKYIEWIGGILSILGLIFIVDSFDLLEAFKTIITIDIYIILGGILLYLIGNCLLFWGWKVQFLPVRDATLQQFLGAFSRSVVAKYLPGNVFQFVARQIDLAKMGYNQKAIALVSIQETIFLLYSALLLSVFSLDNIFSNYMSLLLQFFPNFSLYIDSTAITVIILVSLVLFSIFLLQNRKNFIPIFLYICFFILFEFVGQLLLSALITELDFRLFQYVPFGAVTFSWVCGFIVLGSPGGIGVREVAFITAVGAINVPDFENIIITLALLLRCITILSDVLFYIVANLFFSFRQED